MIEVTRPSPLFWSDLNGVRECKECLAERLATDVRTTLRRLPPAVGEENSLLELEAENSMTREGVLKH